MTSSIAGNVFRYAAGSGDLGFTSYGGSSGLTPINNHLTAPTTYATAQNGVENFSMSLEDEDGIGLYDTSRVTGDTDGYGITSAACKALAQRVTLALTQVTMPTTHGTHGRPLIAGGSAQEAVVPGNKRIKKVFIRVVVENMP